MPQIYITAVLAYDKMESFEKEWKNMSILSDKFFHFVNQKKQNIAGLAEAATAYGIEDDEEEYQLYTELEAGGLQVYWFQQYYQGGRCMVPD